VRAGTLLSLYLQCLATQLLKHNYTKTLCWIEGKIIVAELFLQHDWQGSDTSVFITLELTVFCGCCYLFVSTLRNQGEDDIERCN
jgi:hypothetical protein